MLLALSLLLNGCASKKVKVTQPGAPSSFELAEKNYLAGNYTAAIAAYEQSLQQNDPHNRLYLDADDRNGRFGFGTRSSGERLLERQRRICGAVGSARRQALREVRY